MSFISSRFKLKCAHDNKYGPCKSPVASKYDESFPKSTTIPKQGATPPPSHLFAIEEKSKNYTRAELFEIKGQMQKNGEINNTLGGLDPRGFFQRTPNEIWKSTHTPI